MGATSITGVGGPGAAFPGQKGPQNNRNVFQPLAGPHVVIAGVMDAVPGLNTYFFTKPLTKSKVNYIVLLTPRCPDIPFAEPPLSFVLPFPVNFVNACLELTTDDVDGNFASFTFHAFATLPFVMQFAVLQTGYTGTPGHL